MSKNKHIVIVEDEQEISRLLTMLLQSEGYQCSQVYRGDQAIEFIRNASVDAVILDIMLPGINGIEICQRLRTFFYGPILMLTGSNDDISEIASFRNGADDFISKPFKPAILTARLEAALRRGPSNDCTHISTANLHIYPHQREAFLADAQLDLTTAEFDLLNLLAQNLGQVVHRDQCCDVLRGLSYDGFDRSIDMKISALRKKLATLDADTKLIKTIRGKGYMLIKAPAIHV